MKLTPVLVALALTATAQATLALPPAIATEDFSGPGPGETSTINFTGIGSVDFIVVLSAGTYILDSVGTTGAATYRLADDVTNISGSGDIDYSPDPVSFEVPAGSNGYTPGSPAQISLLLTGASNTVWYTGSFVITNVATAVPEPANAALMMAGLVGLMGVAARRRIGSNKI